MKGTIGTKETKGTKGTKGTKETKGKSLSTDVRSHLFRLLCPLGLFGPCHTLSHESHYPTPCDCVTV